MPVRPKTDPSRWKIQRERLALPEEEPPPGEPDLALRPAICRILKNVDAASASPLAQIAARWSVLAGPRAAAHSLPARLADRILYVCVDSSSWLAEIKRYAAGKILAAAQKEFGRDTVREIRYSVDPVECRAMRKTQ